MSRNLKNFACHDANPFREETLPFIKEKKHRTNYISQGDKHLLNSQTGDLEPALTVQFNMKPVDTQEFTKIFTDFMGLMVNLKSPAQRVLHFLLKHIQQNSDMVEFNVTRCQEFCGFKSCRSVYEGLGELLEKRFIARTKLHYKYYINHNFFFNGSRLPLLKPLLAAPKFKELPKSDNF